MRFAFCRMRPVLNAAPLAHLGNVDTVMAQLASRFPAPDLRPRRLSPLQSLAHAIIHQQLNSTAAGTILKRFVALFDGNSFPSPEDVIRLDVDRLRSAGLSHPKANYIRDLAQKTMDGIVPSLKECDHLTDAELCRTANEYQRRWPVDCRDATDFQLGAPTRRTAELAEPLYAS